MRTIHVTCWLAVILNLCLAQNALPDCGYLTIERSDSTAGFSHSPADLVIKYSVTNLPALQTNEWPQLVVFLARTNGLKCDGGLVQKLYLNDPRGKLRDGSFLLERLQATNISIISVAEIGRASSGEHELFRLSIYDDKKNCIRNGAVLEIPLERLTHGMQESRIDWDLFGSEVYVSAALVANKTEKGDFVFQRFLSNIATNRFTTR
jgi:hypothetical protein